jgi:hypothetical protein
MMNDELSRGNILSAGEMDLVDKGGFGDSRENVEKINFSSSYSEFWHFMNGQTQGLLLYVFAHFPFFCKSTAGML